MTMSLPLDAVMVSSHFLSSVDSEDLFLSGLYMEKVCPGSRVNVSVVRELNAGMLEAH